MPYQAMWLCASWKPVTTTAPERSMRLFASISTASAPSATTRPPCTATASTARKSAPLSTRAPVYTTTTRRAKKPIDRSIGKLESAHIAVATTRTVTLEKLNGVAVVTLNRPGRLNEVGPALLDDLRAFLNELSASEARSVV